MSNSNTNLNKNLIKHDKLLILNLDLRFNLYIKNILLSASVLTNIFLIYKYREK
jgi:hypothetical protein